MVKNYGRVVGRISRVEMKFTNSGTAVCNISVGANDSHYDKQASEWVNHDTVWWDISLWGKDAEKATEMNIAKGDHFTCEGEIAINTYPKKDGGTGFSLKINRPDAWGWQPKDTAIGTSNVNPASEENDPWN